MTTYPVAMPSTTHIESAVLSMDFSVGMTESPYTYNQQTYNWGGARWRIDFSPPFMKKDEAEEWICFLLSLRGRLGTFLAGDPTGKNPRGVGGGTPLVNGGGQTGGQLSVDGAPVSTANWLKKGDYFQIGTGLAARLYKLISNASSNASGQVVLDFVPDLRISPNDNVAVIINDPKGLFRSTSNSPTWSADAADKILRTNFSATEVL